LLHASKQMATIPVREIEQRFGVAIPESELRFGGVIGIAELVDCVSEHGSRWFEGPWGLVLHNARPLPFVRFPGQLGIFHVPDELVGAPGSRRRRSSARLMGFNDFRILQGQETALGASRTAIPVHAPSK